MIPFSVIFSSEICSAVSESYVTYDYYNSETGTECVYHTPNSDLEEGITACPSGESSTLLSTVHEFGISTSSSV